MLRKMHGDWVNLGLFGVVSRGDRAHDSEEEGAARECRGGCVENRVKEREKGLRENELDQTDARSTKRVTYIHAFVESRA
jgi:hypothetical protein